MPRLLGKTLPISYFGKPVILPDRAVDDWSQSVAAFLRQTCAACLSTTDTGWPYRNVVQDCYWDSRIVRTTLRHATRRRLASRTKI